MLENKIEFEPKVYSQFKIGEKQALPSAQDMLRQATLRLGGPNGQVVNVRDIRYYLDARLLSHLESGDRGF